MTESRQAVGQERPAGLRIVRPGQGDLRERAHRVLRARHLSDKTAKAYLYWINRYLQFYQPVDPADLHEEHVNRFLTELAITGKVAASTQNQALSALLFMYDQVLGRPLDRVDGVVRARKPKSLPVVLARHEVGTVLSRLTPPALLVCQLLYGSGLRLNEALNLRVKEVDLQRREIRMKQAKGRKDRLTMVPGSLSVALHQHLRRSKAHHEAFLKLGLGRVVLPNALARKYPNAEREWPWQWVFPAATHYTDRATGVAYRHHLHPSVVQKAVRRVALESGLHKHVTPHTC